MRRTPRSSEAGAPVLAAEVASQDLRFLFKPLPWVWMGAPGHRSSRWKGATLLSACVGSYMGHREAGAHARWATASQICAWSPIESVIFLQLFFLRLQQAFSSYGDSA